MSNKNVKTRLIERFGDTLCFSYPKNKNNAIMFFSSSIKAEESIVDKLRNKDHVRECARILKDECQTYDFKLEKSYKTSEDLLLSYNNWMSNKLAHWEKFFSELFPYYKQSDTIQRKCRLVNSRYFQKVQKTRTRDFERNND